MKILLFNILLTEKTCMTGEELRNKLKKTGFSIAGLARDLGMSQQNLNQALNAKDVKTGLVENLSKVLDVPITFFYEGTELEKDRKVLDDREKDREIMYLRGQVAAYEKALGVGRSTPIEKADAG